MKNLISRRTNDIWIPAAARPQTLGLSPIYKRRFKIDRNGCIYQEFGCHHTGYDERYCMCSQTRTKRRKSTSVAFSFCYKLSVFFGFIYYSRSFYSITELDKSNLLKRMHFICIKQRGLPRNRWLLLLKIYFWEKQHDFYPFLSFQSYRLLFQLRVV